MIPYSSRKGSSSSLNQETVSFEPCTLGVGPEAMEFGFRVGFRV